MTPPPFSLPDRSARSDSLNDSPAVAPTEVSILQILRPLAGELGPDLFRLLVAESAQQRVEGTSEPSAHPAPSDVAGSITRWGEALARQELGELELVDLDVEAKTATVHVVNPWELRVQAGLPDAEKWGCPMLLGELIAVLSRSLGVQCWADERCECEADWAMAAFRIYRSKRTLAARIAALREQRDREKSSEIRRREDGLATQRVEMERRSRELIRQRTRELRDEILQREQAELIKDDLVATVSHELRTPLTSLLGFAELMLDREFPPETRRRYLEIIHTEARRLSRLVDDFLDLQRMESGAESCRLAPIDLADVIRDCGEVFSGGAHVIETRVPSRLPPVLADAERLRQVLSNLLSNAIKYSPGADRVRINAEVVGDEVLIRVRDDGMGIPEEALPNLFEKFYRIHSDSTDGIGGTGLGLAIAKNIVDDHGGRIWAETTQGVGSTFTVALPLAKE